MNAMTVPPHPASTAPQDSADAGRRVRLDDRGPGPITAGVLADPPTTVAAALTAAASWTAHRPYLGQGRTLDVWEALATLGGLDLALARAAEPHLDAVTILHQAGRVADPGATWGVFAAEGPDVRLEGVRDGDRWRLHGTKPWCSLAGSLSHGLVTAWVSQDERRLFSVDLGQPGVTVAPDAWPARGLVEIPSGPVSFDGATAEPVGEPGWYLRRPGFAWGGLSVAACWFGGTVGVARRLLAAAAAPGRADDTLLLMHLGIVDARLNEARTALVDAARRIDAGAAEGDAGVLLAQRVRATVATAAEITLRQVGHALGPAPLAHDAEHSKRVADLQLYVRQHHAERDDLALGRLVRDTGGDW